MTIRENMESGFAFEEEWAREMGLQRVPGSGNTPWYKLDLHGYAARWSLKFTKHKAVPISTNEIDEAVDACQGSGGSGEMPLWGVRLLGNPKYDLVIMRKDDFKRIVEEKLTLTQESRADAKRRTARVPAILREET